MYYSPQLGRLLKETREKQNLTLQMVATRIGSSVQFVCDVESGRKGFPPAKLRNWSAALNIIPDLIIAQLISQSVDQLERWSGYKIEYTLHPKKVTDTHGKQIKE